MVLSTGWRHSEQCEPGIGFMIFQVILFIMLMVDGIQVGVSVVVWQWDTLRLLHDLR